MTSVDVFQFTGPRDLLLCLEDMTDRFSKEPDSKPLAALTAVLAWSIADWVYKSHGEHLGFAKLKELQNDIKTREPVFALLQGLGNAFKHAGELTDQSTVIKSAQVERYLDDGYVDDGYVKDWLSIERNGGNRIGCAEAFTRAVTFWNDFFLRHGI